LFNGEALLVDDIKSNSQGESRGATNLVKIAEDAREFAAEREITEEPALEEGIQEKRKNGAEQG